MFEVSIILNDDSAELVTGGVNGFVKVSLSNFAYSSSFGSSTFIERIREGIISLFGEVLGKGASLSMVVDEDAPAISGGSRVAVEIAIDTTHRGGLADVEAA
ncbi:hypothetical protein Tco_1187196 [Tanacetum coccineum]